MQLFEHALNIGAPTSSSPGHAEGLPVFSHSRLGTTKKRPGGVRRADLWSRVSWVQDACIIPLVLILFRRFEWLARPSVSQRN